MNLENSHYDAFISYRHSELDKFVAENVHRELEKLKFPKKLMKEGKGNGKRKIARVFRDQEELPLTSDLAEPITNALKNSEYLIVICSPRLPESIWCRREVETFIELHGRENVFAVLIEGRAHESFPDSILWAEQVVRDQNGFIRIERNPVEPLAADVRGKDKKEIKKKIKSEILRLAAPMFDVSFDDLKQRHREQKMRRLMMFSVAVSLVFLTFGAISTTMALQIRKQSQKIQSQSEELQMQYDTAMKNQANLIAAETQELISCGNRKEAIKKLLAVMPDSLGTDESIPYTASTENALGKALYTYEMGDHAKAYSTFKMDSNAFYIELSPDGDKLLSIDDKKNIYIWDVETEECLMKLSSAQDTEEAPSTGITKAVFADNSHIIYESNNGYILYNLDGEKIDVRYEQENEYSTLFFAFYEPGVDAIVFDTLDQYVVYQVSTGEILTSLPIAENQKAAGVFGYTEDKSSLIYTTEGSSFKEIIESHVMKVDTKSWEIQKEYTIPYANIWDLKVLDDNILMIVNEDEQNTPIYVPDYDFLSLNLQDGTINWNRDCDWGIPSKIYGISSWENKLIAVDCSGTLVTLNRDTGEVNGVMTTGEKMASCEPSHTVEGAFNLITENGDAYNYLSDLQTYRKSIMIFMDDEPIKQISKNDSVITTIQADSPEIVIYKYVKGNRVEFVQEYEQHISAMDLNKAGTRLLLKTYGDKCHYYLYDEETFSLIKEIIPDDDAPNTTGLFVGDGEEKFLIMGDKMHYYSAEDGSEIEQTELLDENGEETIDPAFLNIHMDTEKKLISFINHGKLYIYDTETMKLLYCMPEAFSETFENIGNSDAFDVSDGMRYFAYSSEDRQRVEIYTLDDNSLCTSIPLNASYVQYLFFDETSSVIYVSFKDGTLSIYDLEDGSLSKTQKFDTSVYSIGKKADQSGSILYGSELYVLDEAGEVKTTVPNYVLYDEKANCFYTVWYQYLSRIPEYSYEELVNEAKEYIQ